MEEIARQSFRIIKFRSRVSHIAIYFNGEWPSIAVTTEGPEISSTCEAYILSHSTIFIPHDSIEHNNYCTSEFWK
jgi:hypothetical protein